MVSRKIMIFSVIAIALLTMACGTVSAYSISVHGSGNSPIVTDSLKSMVSGMEGSTGLTEYLQSISGAKPTSSTATGSIGTASAFSNMVQQSGNEDGTSSVLRFEQSVRVHGTINYFGYNANFNSGML